MRREIRVKIMSALLAFICVIMTFSSCSKSDGYRYESGKINIITSLFPQYDMARYITGDKGNVKLLLPPGTESHNFEPTSYDILDINQCDMFIYTGDVLEPWAATIVKSVTAENFTAVDCSAGIDTEVHEGENDHEEEEHIHGDAHIWLDLNLAAVMADNICVAVTEKDPKNAEIYKSKTEEYKNRLKQFDDEIMEAAKNAPIDTLVFCGPFGYANFFNRYNIRYVTAYDSCSAEIEPSIKKIGEIQDFIRANNIKYIFTDSMSQTKTAELVASETKTSILYFSSAHNRSKDETERGLSFFDIIQGNINNIKKGLE